jgi:UDP-glucose 4-epimerase
MRIVIVGGTGNVGTALLRALTAEPAVTSVLGVARRLPDRTADPYRHARWAALDLAAPDDAPVVDELTRLFAGADAVVHLAWLIQPNRDRDLLRRTNVDGTRRVGEAAARAGVPHLVVASSVGAYSRAHDDVPHAEDWPTRGIASSHYSVDKAAQERVLDDLERRHPGLRVARVRPALIFQGDAGHEIVRYFVGPLVPVGFLRGHLPVLPLPSGLRLQAVHADDVADAYLRVVLGRHGGAFNVAAPELLRGPDLARVVGHGRVLGLPRAVVRAALATAYDLRAVPTDPGWLDMGTGVPVMDTTRAVTELGWRPRHSAAAALADVVAGMADGRGLASGPLRPATHSDGSSPVDDGAGVPAELDTELLGLYLSDHLTGATAGLGRIDRMVGSYPDSPFHPDLAELAAQIRAERALYVSLLPALGLPRRPWRQAAAGLAERLGRLKLNGRVVSRSPLSLVLEVELMRSAVVGKLGGWQTLHDLAPELGLDPERFAVLAARAHRQLALLDRLHEHARRGAFHLA